MAFALCPVCNDMFHLSLRGGPREWEAWEREHVRERAADGTPLLKCVRCWVELKPGHRVVLRELPSELSGVLSVGATGVVSAGAGSGSGKVPVQFGGLSVELPREALFYVVGSAVKGR